VLLSGPCSPSQWYTLRRGYTIVTVVSCADLPKCVTIDPYIPPYDAYFGRVIIGDSKGTPVGPNVPMVESSQTVEELCPPLEVN
jgi:hypothetical protein